jgi:hypothetical protein
MGEKIRGFDLSSGREKEYWLTYWEQLLKIRGDFDQASAVFINECIRPCQCDELTQKTTFMVDIYNKGISNVRSGNYSFENGVVRPYGLLVCLCSGEQKGSELVSVIRSFRSVCLDHSTRTTDRLEQIRTGVGNVDKVNNQIFNELNKLIYDT